MATHSSMENPVDRRAWRATVHRVAKSRTQIKQLSTHAGFIPSALLGGYNPAPEGACNLPRLLRVSAWGLLGFALRRAPRWGTLEGPPQPGEAPPSAVLGYALDHLSLTPAPGLTLNHNIALPPPHQPRLQLTQPHPQLPSSSALFLA